MAFGCQRTMITVLIQIQERMENDQDVIILALERDWKALTYLKIKMWGKCHSIQM